MLDTPPGSSFFGSKMSFSFQILPSEPSGSSAQFTIAGTGTVLGSETPLQGMKVQDYQKKDMRTFTYENPDKEVGSDAFVQREEWVYNFETKLPEKREVIMPPAVMQIFLEILTNATDCINRSRRQGWKPRNLNDVTIQVQMDRKTITVRNYGNPIPVEQHPEYDCYVPTLVFGTMLSSSNYDIERHEGGKNGIGGKAGNIFSKRFHVVVHNEDSGKHFEQTWSNNMLEVSSPQVSLVPKGLNSYVEVNYELDFARFKYDPSTGYQDEAFNLYAHMCLINAHACKASISFNGFVFDDFHIKDFAKLYFGDVVDTAVIHYELADPETEEIKKRKTKDGSMAPTPVVKKGQPERVVVPLVEILLIDSVLSERAPPGTILSFVNCLYTNDNGVHVDSIYSKIVPAITAYVNEKPAGTSKKGKKKENPYAKKKAQAQAKAAGPKPQITATDVRPLLSGIFLCRVVDPKFTSQTKSKLSSFKDKRTPDKENSTLVLTFEESFLKSIYRWDLMERLKQTLRSKRMNILSKTDGSKKKNIAMERGFDANFAGTKNSGSCCLWILEGKSALNYAFKLISKFGGAARDTIGVLPIRGKFLNVKKATPERMVGNREIKLIKELLGLRENVNYAIPENRAQLRYGSIMIMADADKDGSHIKGLLYNFFDELYRELLQIGFVIDYRTKYLKASKSRNHANFYTETEFEYWKAVNPDWKTWKFSYYKGLGSSEDCDVIEDKNNIRTVQLIYDESASYMFQLAFGKANADARKRWIENWRNTQNKDYILSNQMDITTFFEREFIGYVLESLHRALPRFADGLKRSQGQILWGVEKKWPSGWNSAKDDKYKVAQLAGYIATKVEYHHNEDCLSEAIINMAQNFCGSNNLPLICDRGCFGTRVCGGEDSSHPRYIYTNPNWCLKLIFRKEDRPILQLLEDEGVEADPKEFYPIIPYALLNGVSGLATAYSTNIFSYNPVDIIQWVMHWITTVPLKRMPNLPKIEPIIMVPWYKNFKGRIRLFPGATTLESSQDDEVALQEGVNDSFLQEEEEAGDPEDPEVEEPNLDVIQARQQIITSTAAIKVNRRYDRVEITGDFEKLANGDIRVTELPVGRWTINYLRWLEIQRGEKKIKDFKDNCTEDDISFTITGLQGRATLRKLNLIRKFTLSNMVLLDPDSIPRRFSSVAEYMESFCHFRLGKYEERKSYEIRSRETELQNLTYRLQFILAYIEDRIQVKRRAKALIEADMEALGIPAHILKEIKIYECTQEKVNEIMLNHQKKTAELDTLKNTHPALLWLNELRELHNEIIKHPELLRTSQPEVVLQPETPTADDDSDLVEEAASSSGFPSFVLV